MITQGELEHFTGTENYYKHPLSKMVYTDGVQYLASKGECYWFIDVVASYQKKLAKIPFQLWTIETRDCKGVVTCREDSDREPIVRQEIPHTDFPFEHFECYVEDGVMLLKSEH